MSVFEFIMVMVSVILALALAQLLRALTEIPTNAKPGSKGNARAPNPEETFPDIKDRQQDQQEFATTRRT